MLRQTFQIFQPVSIAGGAMQKGITVLVHLKNRPVRGSKIMTNVI